MYKILKCLETISQQYQLIFPIHPRTKKSLPAHFITACSNMLFTEPLGYLQFLKLQKNAAFVITDSGGIQEESTYLGVPCFTLRNNTERPVTVQLGTNILVGTHIENLKNEVNKFLNGERKQASIPPLWDGKAAQRIAGIVNELMMQNDEVVK